jgi:hypothetical protein
MHPKGALEAIYLHAQDWYAPCCTLDRHDAGGPASQQKKTTHCFYWAMILDHTASLLIVRQ